ncbi:ABC transporter substrate-binding protein [Paenibacillus ginsengarvi]|uniref:Extracellular solute-binding protein n=1 Tax=Paenibacillus ginsengarvi TaxID=400777 RepID=A0A3B0CMN9_9BACL|nr:extracellular solute-binding protein [Paenibacillus ginsengarvi]RKN85226.1 extracellular solute-binding protein [Paenibacillus ginsengarvi]
MVSIRNKTVVSFGFFAMILTAAGCSGGGNESEGIKPPVPVNEPVTVKVAASNVQFSEEDFKLYLSDPVKKKYPHITVERINTSEKGSSLNELVAAGNIPDLVGYYPGNLVNVGDLGLSYNIEELIKKHKFDLTRVVPEALDAVKMGSNQSYLTGLPSYHNPFGLFYNKDLFDKFGVAYPKDGMTWEEVRDLAVKLTRQDGGVQYRGIFADFLYRGGRQLSLPYADFQTNKASLNTDSWQELAKLWESLYNIPGLMDGAYKTISYAPNEQSFLKGELAMLAGYSNTLAALRKTPNMNWDVVTYPSNKKVPGVGHRLDSPVLSLTAQSKVKDAAFQVLETMLSDEVQTEMVRNARMTVLNSQAVKDQFGKGMADLQGKNIIAMTKPKMAKMVQVQFLNEGQVDAITNKMFQSIVDKTADINSALRLADEELNKHIESQLQKQKK